MDPDAWYDEARLSCFECIHYFNDNYLQDLLTQYKKLIEKVYTPEERRLDYSTPMRRKIESCLNKAGISFVPYMDSSDVPEEQYEKALDIFIKFLIEEGGR